MKLIFSFLLIINSQVTMARDIILITYIKSKKEKAFLLKDLLNRDQRIPESYITLQEEKNPCLKRKESLLHYCFNENQEHFIYRNDKAIAISLKHMQTFWSSKERQK